MRCSIIPNSSLSAFSVVSALMVSSVALAIVACGPPKNYTPVAEIPKLQTLKDVMDVQATTADPQFKKMDATAYSDAEFAELADTAQKIDATSKHIKDFSKGPGFDALADQLNAKAAALGQAAAAKDAAGASKALSEMKATCKSCHSQFK